VLLQGRFDLPCSMLAMLVPAADLCPVVCRRLPHTVVIECCRYAEKDANMTFTATPLGEALVSGYRAMGLASLWTPDLRGRIEAGISAVAAGQRTKVWL
jgi:hypothetical protein